jgi:CubicO group peptidase (beta-lactamase class C family)
MKSGVDVTKLPFQSISIQTHRNDNIVMPIHNMYFIWGKTIYIIVSGSKSQMKMKTQILKLARPYHTALLIKSLRHLILALLVQAPFSHYLNAQNQPPEFIKEAVGQVEKMLDSKDDSAILIFIEQSMVDRDDRNIDSLVGRLKDIRQEMRGLRDNISIEGEQDGVRLIMSNGRVEKHLRIEMDIKAQAISDLFMVATPEPIILTIDNLSETFDQLENDGVAGVIYVKIDDKVIIKRAFGHANKDLAIYNKTNTIFGTGSRPIDYTIAAIYLLDQKGLLNLDDSIGIYFRNVPKDKVSITIHHLLTGQSGLPDFFHTDEDWDPDLGWIDRETAVKRLLSQELLFEPGTDRAHSHGAFGLLAALIEIIADKTYYSFLNENFFKPAGMTRTGEYGETKGLTINDFAVGGGPQLIGLPNIPPNWGPTSWLIKGSGGMYSTLDDLLNFYGYVRSNNVLDATHNIVFLKPTVNLDGSDRGFELFSAYMPPNNEIYLLLNKTGDRDKMRQLIRALEHLAEPQ